jgi:hypothetical protein
MISPSSSNFSKMAIPHNLMLNPSVPPSGQAWQGLTFLKSKMQIMFLARNEYYRCLSDFDVRGGEILLSVFF